MNIRIQDDRSIYQDTSMQIKGLALAFTTLSIISCSHLSTNQSLEQELFHNFAYSICIGSAFASEDIKNDANRSASGYMELGHMPFEAYEELSNHIDLWLKKEYLSKSGGSLQIMKCNDFYNSGEIQELYHKYDPCTSKTGWPDIDEFNKHCGH